VAGPEPGTFRDTKTGASYALPSAWGGEYATLGPVSREEFERLSAKVSFFADSITRQKPEAVADMIAALAHEGQDDVSRH
jgi:hypothetical protein